MRRIDAIRLTNVITREILRCARRQVRASCNAQSGPCYGVSFKSGARHGSQRPSDSHSRRCGLGGLSLAIALGRNGRPVRVLEQASEIAPFGYGIQLGPNVFPVFDRLGVTDSVLRASIRPPALRAIVLGAVPSSDRAKFRRFHVLLAVLVVCSLHPLWAAEGAIRVAPQWDKVRSTSKLNVTIHVCIEPPMRRGAPIHDKLFEALREFGGQYQRILAWNPYPKLAVPELDPPADGRTHWDFTYLDAMMADFMVAAEGRPVMVNLGTVPAWMIPARKPGRYSDNPDEIVWNYYGDDSEITDAAIKAVAEYQGRLASWYMNGGITDEYGKWHASGHAYTNIVLWEVLSEPDIEHRLTPEQYVKFYDAIVEEVRRVVPKMKFVGPGVAFTSAASDYMTYFIDPRNHKPNIPIDMVSYHLYVIPDADESAEAMQYTFFEDADAMLSNARYIDSLRRKYLPGAGTAITEVGSSLAVPESPKLLAPIPRSYWNLSAAYFAYLVGNLAGMGIDLVYVSELIDYPGQFPANTLVDWRTGEPNARYWVARLLRENFSPGDRLVPAAVPAHSPFVEPDPAAQIFTQGFISQDGDRRILIVNKRDRLARLSVAGAKGGTIEFVDENTRRGPVRRAMTSDGLELQSFAVAVVSLPR
jgi:hypothetical protein